MPPHMSGAPKDRSVAYELTLRRPLRSSRHRRRHPEAGLNLSIRLNSVPFAQWKAFMCLLRTSFERRLVHRLRYGAQRLRRMLARLVVLVSTGCWSLLPALLNVMFAVEYADLGTW
jgi:hypothetical protein